MYVLVDMEWISNQHGNHWPTPVSYTHLTYFNILQARYFDVYCTSNEEAYLNLGISSSTYYRHIKPAIRAYAANLWCVVIPDLIIREHLQQSGSVTAQVEVS